MNENAIGRISAAELVRLIEAEKTDSGYEFTIRNDKYLSRIGSDVLAEYSGIASDLMEHVSELVEAGSVSAEGLKALSNQIDEEYPEKDEQERILFYVMRARSQGIIDDFFEECIQKQTALKGWPVNSATHTLIERPAVMSYILSAMDVYANGYKEDAERYYGSGAYWLLRALIARDPRTQKEGDGALDCV